MKLESYQYIYLIGIGGIGMSALARFFNCNGQKVFGYDSENTELINDLKKEGIIIHHDASVDNIPESIKGLKSDDLLVIYTTAVPFSNDEIQYFIKKQIPLHKRSEILGLISREFFTIAIAGTHGKTTTCAVLTHILNSCGKDITAFMGGISTNYNSNLLYSKTSNILVVEADEYDYSFLELSPDIAIITSIDYDHTDVYSTKEELEGAFIKFVSQIKKNGCLFVEESVKIDFSISKYVKKYTFSSSRKADFFAKNIKNDGVKTIFDLRIHDSSIFCDSILFSLPGKHNISNCVAAAAVSYFLGINFEAISEAITNFKGIKRRFEFVLIKEDLIFIDDYAHHPSELIFTIQTIKEMFPLRHLTVVFQPHLYTRTRDLKEDFAISLSLADQLILLDIYGAREKPISEIDSNMLLELCTNSSKTICSKHNLVQNLKNESIDILLTAGAGDISSYVSPIKRILN